MFENNERRVYLECLFEMKGGKEERHDIFVRIHMCICFTCFLISSQLLAEFTRLPLPGFKGGFGVHQLV